MTPPPSNPCVIEHVLHGCKLLGIDWKDVMIRGKRAGRKTFRTRDRLIRWAYHNPLPHGFPPSTTELAHALGGTTHTTIVASLQRSARLIALNETRTPAGLHSERIAPIFPPRGGPASGCSGAGKTNEETRAA